LAVMKNNPLWFLSLYSAITFFSHVLIRQMCKDAQVSYNLWFEDCKWTKLLLWNHISEHLTVWISFLRFNCIVIGTNCLVFIIPLEVSLLCLFITFCHQQYRYGNCKTEGSSVWDPEDLYDDRTLESIKTYS